MKSILLGILTIGIILAVLLCFDATRSASPQSYFVQSTHTFYKRLDEQLSPKSVLFVGDSMVQGLAVSEISEKAINFGIGTDTVSGVRTRLEEYKSKNSSECLFISVGINDLLQRHSVASTLQEFTNLFRSLSKHPKVLIGEILPVRSLSPKLERVNGEISALNSMLAQEIENYDNVLLVKQYDIFLERGNELSDAYHIGDGLHLNAAGNRRWIDHLKQQLRLNQCEIEN